MGDKEIETLDGNSNLDGGKGSKMPLSFEKIKLALKDEKRKNNANSNSSK